MPRAVAGPTLWQPRAVAPILVPMNFFRRISPISAGADLYAYLRKRRPHQIVFLALAFGVTVGMFELFILDSRIEQPHLTVPKERRGDPGGRNKSPISTPSPATSYSAPPASACSMANSVCSKQ